MEKFRIHNKCILFMYMNKFCHHKFIIVVMHNFINTQTVSDTNESAKRIIKMSGVK